MNDKKAKFALGRIVITPAARANLPSADVVTALARHQSGDWGPIDEESRAENALGLEYGFQLRSGYRASNRTKFIVITSDDRAVTTVLLFDED